VNILRNIKLVAVLGLGLFTALAAGRLLMNRRSRAVDTPAPVPEQLQPAETPADAQPAKRADRNRPAVQTTKPLQDEMKPVNSLSEESGYEHPFSEADQDPAENPSAKTEREKLRAALAGAAASGNVRELAALLHSGDLYSEIEAVRLLARNGSGEALAAALGKILTVPADSPDYNKFIKAFANSRSAAVAEWLTGFLGQTQTEDVRQRVFSILASLNGPEVIDGLAAGLARPGDARHAEDCAELLARSSDPEQAAALRDLLTAGETAEIQTAAARGLAGVGSGAAVATLMDAGASAEAVAAASLAALATVDSSYAQETLIEAAVNPSIPPEVRYAAVEALSTQSGQRVRTALANLGQGTGDPVLQAAIEQALQTTGQSGTPPPSGNPAGISGLDGEIWF
jgi:hypothetical protein